MITRVTIREILRSKMLIIVFTEVFLSGEILVADVGPVLIPPVQPCALIPDKLHLFVHRFLSDDPNISFSGFSYSSSKEAGQWIIW